MHDTLAHFAAAGMPLTPRELLATESEFPGLLDDLIVEHWQRQVIENRLDPKKKD